MTQILRCLKNVVACFSFWFYICLRREDKSSSCLFLLCSGRLNKIPLTTRLVNNRYLFLTVLEAGCPSQGASVVRWGRSSRLQTSHFTRMEGAGAPPPASIMRTYVSFIREEPSWPNHSLTPHLLGPSHWALGFQHMNLGATNIQSTVPRCSTLTVSRSVTTVIRFHRRKSGLYKFVKHQKNSHLYHLELTYV